MPWVLGLVLKARQFRVISPRRCICKHSLTTWNFKAGSWISKLKFAQKRRISRSHCIGSRIWKHPARWKTSSIQNQLREKISLIMKNWIWWWRQSRKGATILLIWSTKLPIVEPWQKEKGKILTPSRRLDNVFSGRHASRRDTCSFLHTHATEDSKTTWEEMEDARKSRLEQASSSVPIVKTQTDEKIWNSLKAGPATKAKNPLSMVSKMKKIVMWFFTSSRMSWLQFWKHSWLSLPISTCWRWERTQRKVEEEGTQGAVASLKEKKNVQGCVSQDSDPMSSILRKVEELGLNASAEHARNS